MATSESVMTKLNLNSDQINSLFAVGPVNGWTGEIVAADIAERFSLNAQEPLGMQLAEQGVLTDDEAEWLDDVE